MLSALPIFLRDRQNFFEKTIPTEFCKSDIMGKIHWSKFCSGQSTLVKNLAENTGNYKLTLRFRMRQCHPGVQHIGWSSLSCQSGCLLLATKELLFLPVLKEHFIIRAGEKACTSKKIIVPGGPAQAALVGQRQDANTTCRASSLCCWNFVTRILQSLLECACNTFSWDPS